MSKKTPLGSFILHPQIKTKHANAESAKLTNHDTDGSASNPTPAPTSESAATGDGFTQAQDSTPVAGVN